MRSPGHGPASYTGRMRPTPDARMVRAEVQDTGEAKMSTQQMTGREVDAEGLDQGLDDPFELLTAYEVAKWLRMTPAWVYAQTRANNIPHVPLGRYVRYRRSAVKAWMAGIEHESAASTFTRERRRL